MTRSASSKNRRITVYASSNRRITGYASSNRRETGYASSKKEKDDWVCQHIVSNECNLLDIRLLASCLKTEMLAFDLFFFIPKVLI
jgi:hypothetical protein